MNDSPGEVFVRREWLRVPISMAWAGVWARPIRDGSPFRYAWADRRVANLAWRTFEEQGWSEFSGFDFDDELENEGPPVYLLAIRSTSDPRYFVATYGLAGNAYLEEDGYLMAAGYVG